MECITTLYDMSNITRLDRFNVEIMISGALSPSLTFGMKDPRNQMTIEIENLSTYARYSFDTFPKGASTSSAAVLHNSLLSSPPPFVALPSTAHNLLSATVSVAA